MNAFVFILVRLFRAGLFCLFIVVGFSDLWASSIRLATLNVRNYLPVTRRIDGVTYKNYPKPEEEKTALRTVVQSVNPDVLALQEMGPAPYLEEFRRDLRDEGLDYPYWVHLKAEDEERHTAILSKIPFRERKHGKLPYPYRAEDDVQHVKRGLLEIILDHEEGEWSVFNLHLKSKLPRKGDPKSALMREMEGRTVAEKIRSLFPDSKRDLYVVLGDFNDQANTPAVTAFTDAPKGEQPVAKPIDARDDKGTPWTSHWDKMDLSETVDYIMVSQAMEPYVKNNRGHIVNTPEMRLGSDHRLVWCDIDFESVAGAGSGSSGKRPLEAAAIEDSEPMDVAQLIDDDDSEGEWIEVRKKRRKKTKETQRKGKKRRSHWFKKVYSKS